MKQQPDREGGLQVRTMQLTRIKVEGYKSFKSLDVEMRPLNVLIGANGAGKSNFLSLFGLLKNIPEERFSRAVSLAGGTDTFLHYGVKKTQELKFSLCFDRGEFSYILLPSESGDFKFDTVQATYEGHSVGIRSNRNECSVFDRTFTEFIADIESKAVDMADFHAVLPIMKITHRFLTSIQNYHFNDTGKSAPFKKQGGINDDFYLRSDGENLAAYLYKIKHKYPKNYERIRESIQLVAPFFDDFVLRPMSLNEHYIRLEWRERDSDHPFFAFQLPDGLIRFICLATLLQLPKEELPSLILIDEPELSLHPYALSLISSLIHTASRKTQIVVATQSVALLNEFAPEDVIVVERNEGNSVAKRLDAAELKGWLKKYSLGELWESNVIGGRPR